MYSPDENSEQQVTLVNYVRVLIVISIKGEEFLLFALLFYDMDLLLQVMPDNKYGIWTEDHITLFSQIVSGKRFNCMPYYVSNDPGQPSIVGLFFNIPERVIKDGNIVMQPGPKQISIHEYMVDKVSRALQYVLVLSFSYEQMDIVCALVFVGF